MTKTFLVVKCTGIFLTTKGGRENNGMGIHPGSHPFSQGRIGGIKAADSGDDLRVEILKCFHVPHVRTIDRGIPAVDDRYDLALIYGITEDCGDFAELTNLFFIVKPLVLFCFPRFFPYMAKSPNP